MHKPHYYLIRWGQTQINQLFESNLEMISMLINMYLLYNHLQVKQVNKRQWPPQLSGDQTIKIMRMIECKLSSKTNTLSISNAFLSSLLKCEESHSPIVHVPVNCYTIILSHYTWLGCHKITDCNDHSTRIPFYQITYHWKFLNLLQNLFKFWKYSHTY